jgi:copper(I)-binding protein
MHLMLFGPGRPLHEDDRVEFSLQLANGNTHRFEARVRRESGVDAHRHHHHHQH